MLVRDVLDVIDQPPQVGDQVGVQHAHVEGSPGRGPFGRYSGRKAGSVRLGDQVELTAVAGGQDEGRTGATGGGQRGQCLVQAAGQLSYGGADRRPSGQLTHR